MNNKNKKTLFIFLAIVFIIGILAYIIISLNGFSSLSVVEPSQDIISTAKGEGRLVIGSFVFDYPMPQLSSSCFDQFSKKNNTFTSSVYTPLCYSVNIQGKEYNAGEIFVINSCVSGKILGMYRQDEFKGGKILPPNNLNAVSSYPEISLQWFLNKDCIETQITSPEGKEYGFSSNSSYDAIIKQDFANNVGGGYVKQEVKLLFRLFEEGITIPKTFQKGNNNILVPINTSVLGKQKSRIRAFIDFRLEEGSAEPASNDNNVIFKVRQRDMRFMDDDIVQHEVSVVPKVQTSIVYDGDNPPTSLSNVNGTIPIASIPESLFQKVINAFKNLFIIIKNVIA